jgi:mitogen-activated protein kinase 1/3
MIDCGKNDILTKPSQLSVIFNILGTPTENDLSFLDNRTRGIFRFLAKRAPRKYSDIYPHSEQSALSLLNVLLQFNPNNRMTAKTAVRHSYFDDVRDDK